MQAAPSALTDDEIIAKALSILGQRVRKTPKFSGPADIKAYLSCHFAGHERESFVVLHLDIHHPVAVHRLPA
jgi:DNA repair protein RadC